MKKKPVAIIRNGNVSTPNGPKGRVEAISPDPNRLNLSGRKTPKGKVLGKGDFDNRTESAINKTLKPAIRQVMKKVVKAKHDVKFPDDDKVYDPSPFYPDEDE